MEISVFVAAASRVGQEPSYTVFGQSAIVGPRGKIYASADEPNERDSVAQLDFDLVRR